MSSPIDVRAATPGDVPEVLRLLTRAHLEQQDQRGGAMWASRHAAPVTIERLTERCESGLVVLGTVQGCPVGAAVARHEPLADGGQVAHIDELYTEPQARGVGVGRRMMASVEQWARSTGCTGIDAIALPGDRSTKNFFEASGLVARAIVVHRSL